MGHRNRSPETLGLPDHWDYSGSGCDSRGFAPRSDLILGFFREEDVARSEFGAQDGGLLDNGRG